MADRIVLPLLALIAIAMVVLALVWPQGQGARSPAPFGHRLAPMEQKLTIGGQTVGTIRGQLDGLEEPEPPAAHHK